MRRERRRRRDVARNAAGRFVGERCHFEGAAGGGRRDSTKRRCHRTPNHTHRDRVRVRGERRRGRRCRVRDRGGGVRRERRRRAPRRGRHRREEPSRGMSPRGNALVRALSRVCLFHRRWRRRRRCVYAAAAGVIHVADGASVSSNVADGSGGGIYVSGASRRCSSRRRVLASTRTSRENPAEASTTRVSSSPSPPARPSRGTRRPTAAAWPSRSIARSRRPSRRRRRRRAASNASSPSTTFRSRIIARRDAAAPRTSPPRSNTGVSPESTVDAPSPPPAPVYFGAGTPPRRVVRVRRVRLRRRIRRRHGSVGPRLRRLSPPGEDAERVDGADVRGVPGGSLRTRRRHGGRRDVRAPSRGRRRARRRGDSGLDGDSGRA